MSAETTTTSTTGAINASLVQPTVILALSERPGIAVRVCREFNGVGQPASALKIPKQTSYWGSPADAGAGVDTEFNGPGEAVDASNTEFALTSVSITPAEYVVAHQVSQTTSEDIGIDDAALLSLMTGSMLSVLQLALDDDLIGLFASLSQGVGATTVDFSLANALDATHGIIRRGANCDAMEYVLDPEQVANVRTAILSAAASTAVYNASADRMIDFQRTDGATRGAGRVMQLDGCLVTMSGLTDTANAGADVVGAAICPSTAQNHATGATTFGLGWKRLPQLEQERHAKSRSTDIVMSMRAGVAELQDGSGTSITSDAP